MSGLAIWQLRGLPPGRRCDGESGGAFLVII